MARERRTDTIARAVVQLRRISRRGSQVGSSQSDGTRETYKDRTVAQRRELAARYHCNDCGLHFPDLAFQGLPLGKSYHEAVDMP